MLVKGVKTVSITTTGHSKDWFTVILVCTADGGNLVYKRKTLPKEEILPAFIVHVHPKGDSRLSR